MKINTRSQLTLVFQDVAVFHPRPCNPEEVPGWLELADCLKADTSPVCLGVIEEAVAAAKVYLGDGDLVVGVPWGGPDGGAEVLPVPPAGRDRGLHG